MENPRELALDVLIKVDKKEALSHRIIGDVLENISYLQSGIELFLPG